MTERFADWRQHNPGHALAAHAETCHACGTALVTLTGTSVWGPVRVVTCPDCPDPEPVPFRQDGPFLQAVAHDLQAPIRHIAGLASVLVDPEVGLEEARSVHAMLEEASQSAIHKLDALRRLAAVQAAPLRPEAVRLEPLFVAEAREAGLQLDTATGDTEAWLDPGQARRLVKILVDNAREAGATAMALRRIDEPGLVLEVSDDGRGIPQGRSEDLLLPFRKASGRGDGLGLAIAECIVRRHGGGLTLHRRDRGVAIRLVLPGSDRSGSAVHPVRRASLS